MWKLSDGTRWISYDKAVISASDSLTGALMTDGAGRQVMVTPIGGIYTPTGPDDEVGLYLLAGDLLGPAASFTGTPPAGLPEPPSFPDGVDV